MRVAAVFGAVVAFSPWSMALAQSEMSAAAPACATIATPPAEMAGWTVRSSQSAAVDAAGLRKAVIVPGTGVDAMLSQTSAVRYALRPEKPGGSVSYGGMFAFTIKQAGTYRVALGSGAWIDMLKDGKALVSTAHGRGPDCTGIRKMVDFALEPGSYVLQLAANGTPTLPMLVTRLP